MKLASEFHFSNNIGMSKIICICMSLSTTFLSTQLSSYWLLCALVLSMPISPETHITTVVMFGQIITGPMDFFDLHSTPKCKMEKK